MSLDLNRLRNVRNVNGKTLARCPACQESGADETGDHLYIGTDGKFGCVAYPGQEGITHRKRIFELAGVKDTPTTPKPPKAKGKLVATYDYTDSAGTLLFQVCRFDPKDFRQRRPDGNGGFLWNLQGVERVLYRLPRVIEAIAAGKLVFIVEGEKDVAAAESIGLCATCNPGGAEKWEPQFTTALARADCVIIPDDDKRGRRHADLVARAIHGTAKSVRILELGGNGKDLADFVETNAEISAFHILALTEATTMWTPSAPEIHIQKHHPWDSAKTDQVREIIAGTALEPIVQAFESVTLPALPLSCTFVKALPVVGCALSLRRDDKYTKEREDHRKGEGLARLRIETGGGQVCNFWALVVSEASSGKDIGSVDVSLTAPRGWLLGSSGSAEGLCDQYVKTNNGFLRIGELESFLNVHHWQSKATSFLVNAFNMGWFYAALSERSKAEPRKTDFCYPNILASVQPQIAARYGAGLLENGFANRFIIGNMPVLNWEPNCEPITTQIDAAKVALECYTSKSGTVIMPQGYLRDFQTKLINIDAPYRGYWRRLKNEYGARLAVVLSIKNGDDGPTVKLATDIWDRVEVVCWWLYAQAYAMFSSLLEDEQSARLEKMLEKILACIRQHGPITGRQISRTAGRGTDAKERSELIAELIERNEILETEKGYISAKTLSQKEG